MPNKTHGDLNKSRASRVFMALFDYVNVDTDKPPLHFSQSDFDEKKDGLTFFFHIKKTRLLEICAKNRKANPKELEKEYYGETVPAISRLVALGRVLDKRTDRDKGAGIWKFDIIFWSIDRAENIRRFDEEWKEKKSNGGFQSIGATVELEPTTPTSTTTTPIKPYIDWLDRSRQLLAAQKHLTTNNLLPLNAKNFDDLHVPLGLIERKERPKVKEEPSPEHGSELDRVEYTETKRYEHDDFLTDVVGKPAGGKHIAIIGEPGAGKTTILMNIGEWLITEATKQTEEPLLVAWISLAGLKDRELSDYFYGKWLKDAHPAANPPPSWKDELAKLVEQRRVWLLLDGLDEVSNSSTPNWLNEQLRGWGQNLRVVMTCRINQWETTGNSLVKSFEVYRTLDYSYQTSKGDNQVQQFISKWFANDENVANQILRELDAPGKERIKDLVKNPLRLTLLCASWEKDTHSLPETQADLYRGFVNYLYDWKAVEFPNEVQLREELNLALGELAKAGLNREPINHGAVRRFRFTASEISKLWKDRSDTLLTAAKNLGWLNMVGKEDRADLYAFYHPTFQEYFAACAIDDWDYFLPKAHIDRPVLYQGKCVPYRVFEQEWRQVILLWIGRRDEVVTDERKEEFIDKLTDFREQEGKFYYYRAYCMAAICVGEFRYSGWADKIVWQIVEWAFGYFNTKMQCWMYYPDFIECPARETIPFTHRGKAISTLVALWIYPDVNTHHLKEVLGKIGVGNTEAIAALVALLSHPDLNADELSDVAGTLRQIDAGNSAEIAALTSPLIIPRIEYMHVRRSGVTGALSQIDAGNSAEIAALLAMLRSHDLNNRQYSRVIRKLGEIGVGNTEAIAALTALLSHPDLNAQQFSDVLQALDRIAVGNKRAIAALLVLLRHPDLNTQQLCEVAAVLGHIDAGNKEAISPLVAALLSSNDRGGWMLSIEAMTLGQILTSENMPLVIWELKNYVTHEVDRIHPFNSSNAILSQCAQTLTYAEFYQAWHSSSLLSIPFDSTSLHQQLNRPNNTIILDITTLNYHTTAELAQELSNRIHHHLNTQPIPQVQNIPQLKPELLNLKPHLALILYHPTPTQTLIQEIIKLHTPKQIQIIWLTTADNVPDGIRPAQENLVAAIWSAIDRFTED
jgi:hypothetical protein